MSEYVSIMDQGKTDEIGALHFLSDLFRPGVATGWGVSQRGAGANMSVDIARGGGIIKRSTDDSGYYGFTTATKNVSVSAADGSNPRKDILVAYVDLSVRSSAIANNINALKFLVVAGTPAGSPADPSDGTIQTAVGSATYPWIKLARISVGTGVSSIVNANITSIASPAAFATGSIYGGSSNTSGHTVPNIADDTFALLAAVQTLTNKTISGTTNKVRSGGANSSLRDSNDVQEDIERRHSEGAYNYVASGGVWTGDSYGVNRNASMTAIVAYINGIRVTASAVTAHTFTASKDTYVDLGVDGVIDYNESTNNAASQSLAADHIRVAIVVTGASTIANAGSINQGQYDKVLPIASSIAYTVSDSLGNLICNRRPYPKVIGYRQVTSPQSSVGTSTDLTGLSALVNIPAGRSVYVIGKGQCLASTANESFIEIKEDGTRLNTGGRVGDSSRSITIESHAAKTPTAGTHTYKLTGTTSTGTFTLEAGATNPAFIMIMLD